MLNHHIQKTILKKLVENKSVKFAALRPTGIDSNLFTYHLKQLVAAKLAKKNATNDYSLTAKGKLLGKTIDLSNIDFIQQAHSVIFVVVRDGNKWLLRRRLVQPEFGKIGFMHGEPKASESLNESAARILSIRTGLKSSQFNVLFSGLIRSFKGNELESFVHFVTIEAANVSGTLSSKDSHGENIWYANPGFTANDMIATMPAITSKILNGDNTFLDISIR